VGRSVAQCATRCELPGLELTISGDSGPTIVASEATCACRPCGSRMEQDATGSELFTRIYIKKESRAS
jgi:hypothetical protein